MKKIFILIILILIVSCSAEESTNIQITDSIDTKEIVESPETVENSETEESEPVIEDDKYTTLKTSQDTFNALDEAVDALE
tara:strand:+ start:1491 stop:1733 length:243 start_codon:yes stop_codon:yes gene_type:complete